MKYIAARGTLVDHDDEAPRRPPHLPAEVDTLKFDHLILATGSSPVVPPMFQIGDPRVMDSTGALNLEDHPQRPSSSAADTSASEWAPSMPPSAPRSPSLSSPPAYSPAPIANS